MSIEHSLAEKVMYSININDFENVEKFYDEYVSYVRGAMGDDFDKKLWNKIVKARGDYFLKFNRSIRRYK